MPINTTIDLHVTTFILSLILTVRLTLTLQPYPDPTNPNHTDPDINHNPEVQI